MLIIQYPGTCPKCGSHDIGEYPYHLECKKCGHTESRKCEPSISYPDRISV